MKKNDIMVATVDTHEDIQFLQDFLANARRDFFLTAGLAELNRLRRLLEAGTDDQLFDEVFPEEEVRDFTNERGKKISYAGLRRTVLRCSHKAYDMLCRSKKKSRELEAASPERVAVCMDIASMLRAAVVN